MKGMAQAEGDEMFVSTAAVGSIVGLQSAEILQMAEEYAEKSADLAAGKKPDKVMGAQAHQRRVAILKKQIATQEKKVQEVREGRGRGRRRRRREGGEGGRGEGGEGGRGAGGEREEGGERRGRGAGEEREKEGGERRGRRREGSGRGEGGGRGEVIVCLSDSTET